MRRSACVLLALLLLVFAIVPVAAAEVEGMSVEANDKYPINKVFEKAPLTYEAWISLPKDAGRAGVIIGNYAGSTACANFEITTNGRPRLYVIEFSSGEKTVHDITFKEIDVRKDEMVHVAIVHDPEKSNTYCYVNGELKSTIAGVLNISQEVCQYTYMLAGDRRGGNGQYFKGNIGEVALYSDVRSAEEIKADMNKIDSSDSELLVWYDTFEQVGDRIEDLSGNGYTVTRTVKWVENKAPVTDYAYSFCVVGDTQVVAKNYPDKLSCIYDWIIENKDEKKIEFVFGLGDITDKNTDAEWTAAKEQISKMNGVLPYSLIRGNHDGTAKLNEYFAKPEYMSQFGGFYEPNRIDNSWRTFSVCGNDYLLITLDYGASDTLLNWAAGIIEKHPEHKVIITTHAYLFRDGTTLDVNDVCPPNASGSNDGARNNGDQMWDKLISKYENIFLVLSGHDPCENVIATQTKGVHGNTVTQMLIDPQGVDSAEGATGMVAMLYFSNDGKTLTVEQYSTVHGKHYMNTSQFALTLPEGFEVDTEVDTAPVSPETTVNETETTDTQTPDTNVSNGDGASIGIIGGADGPTVILVGTVLAKRIMGVLGVVAVAAIGFAVGFIVGRKKKK